MPYDAIIIGASIIDIPAGPVDASVFSTGSHPVDRLAFQVGGDAINEGDRPVPPGADIKLVSKIGSDPGGDFILQHCSRHRIDTSSIVRDPSMDTGINIVLIEKTGAQLYHQQKRGLRQLKPGTSTCLYFQRAPCCAFASIFVFPYFQNDDLVRIFSKAKEHGMTLCADMTKCKNKETTEDIREALSYLDFVFSKSGGSTDGYPERRSG